MKSKSVRRMLGALVGPGAISFSIAVACEPQDIYLFDERPESSDDDAGTREPELGPEPLPAPMPEPDTEALARVQPVCASAACDACVEGGDCSVEGAAFFCHPATGECQLACDPDAARACPAAEQCDPRIGLCVECVLNADCGAVPQAVCDGRRGQCVECVGSATCPIERPVCDLAVSRCVECQQDEQCALGNVCLPDEQRCAQCADDSDCGGLEDDNLCLPGEQRCVECVEDGDCTEPGRPFCSLERECEDERE